uniref:ACYPI009109 protein n=1 Tax=Acyrthosiphon pisum TaxID=7029 RepID=C4WXJ2_ACYPI|nr:ACYPI009109 [Acyrthosiphon pisum]
MSGAAVEIGNNRCSDSDGTTVRVRVIAPSSMGKPSNLEVFRRFLRDAGMTARVDDSIYRAGADPFYANTDQFRAADLVDALTDSCTVACSTAPRPSCSVRSVWRSSPRVTVTAYRRRTTT